MEKKIKVFLALVEIKTITVYTRARGLEGPGAGKAKMTLPTGRAGSIKQKRIY